jgi:hypothetical protein
VKLVFLSELNTIRKAAVFNAAQKSKEIERRNNKIGDKEKKIGQVMRSLIY